MRRDGRDGALGQEKWRIRGDERSSAGFAFAPPAAAAAAAGGGGERNSLFSREENYSRVTTFLFF